MPDPHRPRVQGERVQPRLGATLTQTRSLLPGGMPAADVQSVKSLVQPRVFGYRYSLQLDGTAQMVLTQPGTTETTIAPTAGG